MNSNIVNNKRIAKNTLFLYLRTILIMVISLYTSRVILKTLGEIDYGIYNVVGGIVVFLSFLNTSMASATQRFLNVAMGKNDNEEIKKVFSNALIIHFFIAIGVLLLVETFGIWFLNTKMNIPSNRLLAANYVLQFSIATMVMTIISVPYNSLIIANEKMSAFACISIVEVALKLTLVLLLVYSPIDKLISYAVLMFLVSCVVRIIYVKYCNKRFHLICKCKLKFDYSTIKEMFNFSAWTILGSIASISHGHGIAIVINNFFGPIINTAYGLACQVNQVVGNFVSNFMVALNPQLVKSYSAGNLSAMHQLLERGCRMGFLLVLFFVVPIIVEAPMLLKMWLGQVPEYTVNFVRLILLVTLFNSFASPLSVSQGATGRIRNYQIVLTIMGLIHIPLTWICFKNGFNPNYAMYVYLLIIIIEQLYRIFKVSVSISMPLIPFVKRMMLRCGSVSVIAFSVTYIAHKTVIPGIWSTLLVCLIGASCVLMFTFLLGIDKNEKTKVLNIIKMKLIK